MKRIEWMFIDIWEGIKIVFKTYPAPTTFLLVWTIFIIWAVASL